FIPASPACMAVDASSGTVLSVPTAQQVGAQTVTLRVRDGRGGVDLQSFQITVTQSNTVPVITSTPKGSAVVGVPYQYQVLAQDADGDPIAFRLDAGPDGMALDGRTGLVTCTPAAPQGRLRHVSVT